MPGTVVHWYSTRAVPGRPGLTRSSSTLKSRLELKSGHNKRQRDPKKGFTTTATFDAQKKRVTL